MASDSKFKFRQEVQQTDPTSGPDGLQLPGSRKFTWFFEDKATGKVLGGFSTLQLRERLKSGQIDGGTKVWNEILCKGWKAIDCLEEFIKRQLVLDEEELAADGKAVAARDLPTDGRPHGSGRRQRSLSSLDFDCISETMLSPDFSKLKSIDQQCTLQSSSKHRRASTRFSLLPELPKLKSSASMPVPRGFAEMQTSNGLEHFGSSGSISQVRSSAAASVCSTTTTTKSGGKFPSPRKVVQKLLDSMYSRGRAHTTDSAVRGGCVADTRLCQKTCTVALKKAGIGAVARIRSHSASPLTTSQEDSRKIAIGGEIGVGSAIGRTPTSSSRATTSCKERKYGRAVVGAVHVDTHGTIHRQSRVSMTPNSYQFGRRAEQWSPVCFPETKTPPPGFGRTGFPLTRALPRRVPFCPMPSPLCAAPRTMRPSPLPMPHSPMCGMPPMAYSSGFGPARFHHRQRGPFITKSPLVRRSSSPSRQRIQESLSVRPQLCRSRSAQPFVEHSTAVGTAADLRRVQAMGDRMVVVPPMAGALMPGIRHPIGFCTPPSFSQAPMLAIPPPHLLSIAAATGGFPHRVFCGPSPRIREHVMSSRFVGPSSVPVSAETHAHYFALAPKSKATKETETVQESVTNQRMEDERKSEAESESESEYENDASDSDVEESSSSSEHSTVVSAVIMEAMEEKCTNSDGDSSYKRVDDDDTYNSVDDEDTDDDDDDSYDSDDSVDSGNHKREASALSYMGRIGEKRSTALSQSLKFCDKSMIAAEIATFSSTEKSSEGKKSKSAEQCVGDDYDDECSDAGFETRSRAAERVRRRRVRRKSASLRSDDRMSLISAMVQKSAQSARRQSDSRKTMDLNLSALKVEIKDLCVLKDARRQMSSSSTLSASSPSLGIGHPLCLSLPPLPRGMSPSASDAESLLKSDATTNEALLFDKKLEECRREMKREVDAMKQRLERQMNSGFQEIHDKIDNVFRKLKQSV